MRHLPAGSNQCVEFAPFTVERRTRRRAVRPPNDLRSYLVSRPRGIDHIDGGAYFDYEMNLEGLKDSDWIADTTKSKHARGP